MLQLIEWKPLQQCWAKALNYRGVIGQWQDVGRSSFDLAWHGGCRDPAGSAALFFALPSLTHSSSHSLKASTQLCNFWLTFRLQVVDGKTRRGNTLHTGGSPHWPSWLKTSRVHGTMVVIILPRCRLSLRCKKCYLTAQSNSQDAHKTGPLPWRGNCLSCCKSVLFPLVIRAWANITELASVIDKPRRVILDPSSIK